MSRGNGNRVQVVVTADDFGLSPAVNGGILSAFREGVVRNTALLVNFAETEEAAALLRAVPALDVGIHLNLTAGPPVSEPHSVASLLREDGTFFPLWTFLARAAAGRIVWSQVRQEWAAQIQRGQRFGLAFSSVSSHQHVHMLPPLTRIAAELARANRIPVVRLSRFVSPGLVASCSPRAVLLNLLSGPARKSLLRSGVRHNDSVIGIDRPESPGAAAVFCRTLAMVPPGFYEVVGHPGRPDDLLRARDLYVSPRTKELEILTAPEVLHVFQSAVELTNYRDSLARVA